MVLGDEKLAVQVSDTSQDDEWDRFLQKNPAGEFEQTCCWAEVKKIEGWGCQRVVMIRKKAILGGFQILWRKTRWGRIGYVTKGPVVAINNKWALALITDLIKKAARELRLVALLVLPPKEGRLSRVIGPKNKFLPNRVMDIITATLVVDISEGMKAVEARMRRNTRQQIRRSYRNNVSVREGGEKDLATFFYLMRQTCKRQGVTPNPSSVAALERLWKTSQTFGGCRLTLAEYQKRPIAGLFCIPFNRIINIWKKGSVPDYLHLNPMEMLYHEAMSWAHGKGYQSADFISLDRDIAESLLNNVPLTEKQRRSRDVFNLGFGGYPVILPNAYIHFTNQVLYQGYLLIVRNSFFYRQLKNGKKVLGFIKKKLC